MSLLVSAIAAHLIMIQTKVKLCICLNFFITFICSEFEPASVVRIDEDGAVMLSSTDHDHHHERDDSEVTLASLALGNPHDETVFK